MGKDEVIESIMETFKHNLMSLPGLLVITITPTLPAPCPQAQSQPNGHRALERSSIMLFAEASQTGIPNTPLPHPHHTPWGPFRAFSLSTVYQMESALSLTFRARPAPPILLELLPGTHYLLELSSVSPHSLCLPLLPGSRHPFPGITLSTPLLPCSPHPPGSDQVPSFLKLPTHKD